jgi:hypothetical protein
VCVSDEFLKLILGNALNLKLLHLFSLVLGRLQFNVCKILNHLLDFFAQFTEVVGQPIIA